MTINERKSKFVETFFVDEMVALKENELIKHSSAIHISNNLTAIERKISNILLKNAFPNLSTDERHTITIRKIASLLGWQPDGSYNKIKQAVKSLIGTTLEWNILDKDKKNEWAASTIIASAMIKEGKCTYSYSPDLRKLLSSPNIYAKLNILIQSQLGSKYSLALWEYLTEILSSERKRKIITGWININDIKKMLGVHDSKIYKEFKIFNRDILKKSVDEITEVSDLQVTVQYKKEQRKVLAVSFEVTKKDDIFERNTHLAEKLMTEEVQQEHESNPQLDNLELQEKLALNYNLSSDQIKKICKNYSDEKIASVIEYIEEQRAAEIKIKNLSAYFIAALKENWNLPVNRGEALIDKENLSSVNYETLPEIWKEIVEELVKSHGLEIYHSWFTKLTFIELNDEGLLILKADNNFIRDWIKSNYLITIRKISTKINQQICEVVII